MIQNNKIPGRLLALALSLLLLFTGCAELSYLPQELLTLPPDSPASTEAVFGTEPAAVPSTEDMSFPVDPEDKALIRWQNAGQRDYLPEEPVRMVPFSQMEYQRPDTEALYADFDALIRDAEQSRDAEDLLERFYGLYDRYVSFYSMDSLANIRYSLNTGDSFYKAEYDFCEAETPKLEEKYEALNKAFAASPCRKELERRYFGEGYFGHYDDYEVYTNPEYLRLSQQEAALLSEYRELSGDPQVEYGGETKSLNDWMESKDYGEYLGALRAYYQQYNSKIGELYLRLVRVRQQLAAALDYDSYADYSYEITYERDYSPEQGRSFLEAIRRELVPVLEKADEDAALMYLSPGSSTEAKVMKMVQSAAENIGGAVWDAYRYMRAYQLCDIGKAAEKVEASFQTYIYDYEAPFVLVNAQGSGEDYCTLSHEFGHFTDAYHNYGASEDLETAETFSQAMEFLALSYTETLSEGQRRDLLRYKLLDALRTFVYQGAYAQFEEEVYRLDPESLTVEKVNELYCQACKDYGIYEEGFDFYYSQSWIDIIHFFEVPYYIISYCVSAQTSLEVFRLEQAKAGDGTAAYFRLLDRSYDAGVRQVMKDAGLGDPFRAEQMEQTAAFFKEQLLGLE